MALGHVETHNPHCYLVVVVWFWPTTHEGPFGIDFWLDGSKTATLWVRSNIVDSWIVVWLLWSIWFGSYGASRDPRGLG